MSCRDKHIHYCTLRDKITQIHYSNVTSVKSIGFIVIEESNLSRGVYCNGRE
jgi:hypothetical protein